MAPLSAHASLNLASNVVRCGIGLIFLGAGALKLPQTQSFAHAVQNYQLTSWTLSTLIAIYLPWLEIAAGLALLSRRLYLGALTTLATLNLIFLCAILSAWSRHLDISCGCFGRELNHTNFPLHVASDLALLAALLALALAERQSARHQSNI